MSGKIMAQDISKLGLLLLLFGLLFTVALFIAAPLPSRVLLPGFTSLAILSGGFITWLYFVTMALILISWYIFGSTRWFAYFLSLTYTVTTVCVWQLKVPGGNLLIGGPSYASVVSSSFPTGHLGLVVTSGLPGLYLLLAQLSTFGNISVPNTFLILDFFMAFSYGSIWFLVAESYLGSSRLSSLATMIAVGGGVQLLRLTALEPLLLLSIVFFSVFTAILLRAGSQSNQGKTMLVLLIISTAITYPLVSVILILVTGLRELGQRVAGHFRHLDTSGRGDFTLVMISLVIGLGWAAWASYLTAASFGRELLTVGFGGPLGRTTTAGIISPYFLFQYISGFSRDLPFELVYLELGWFLLLFVVGFLVWLIPRGYHSGERRPQYWLVAPLIIAALSLALLPGGSDWLRIPPFLGIFFAVSIVARAESRSKALIVILATCLLMLTPFTVSSSVPAIGIGGAQYGWEFATGGFLLAQEQGNPVIVGLGAESLNYTLYHRINLGMQQLLPSTATSPFDERLILNSTILSFEGSRTDLMVISPLLFDQLRYTYGNTDAAIAKSLVANVADAASMVYNNGYSQIWVTV